MSSTSLSFFSATTSTFRPLPYQMASGSSASSSRPSFSTKNPARNHDSLTIPHGMDPLPTDPNVLFIHPPFNTFPNAHLYSDGLTYNLMAENPEWFLDPKDFVSQGNTNHNAIAYPPYLEPPRGWCPAKKKDLKERGGEGWPEGEEPRLRCTFCRRNYAGVNAKSMWRRHVFEKHKIAMSNRRDGNSDRPRGRGSGKENKHIVAVKSSDSHDGLVSLIVAPQAAPDNSTHKSQFRNETAKKRKKDQKEGSVPLTPRQTKNVLQSLSEDDSESETQLKPSTPPLTPHVEESSDPPNVFVSEEFTVSSPVILCPVIPDSPYNPLQTPSFRHSPPSLPSDQPWRYLSPSHPLHLSARELSLTMLTKPMDTPLVTCAPMLGTSPSTTIHSSPLLNTTQLEASITETPTPSRFLFPKPTKFMRLFDQISSPVSSGKSLGQRQRITSSPLPFAARQTPKTHSRHNSDISEPWFTDDRLVSSTSSLPASTSYPFSVYESWSAIGDIAVSPVRPAKPPVETDSPVVRNGSFQSPSDIQLSKSFEEVPRIKDIIDEDVKEMLLSPVTKDSLRPEGKRLMPPAMNSEFSPPSKKRRMSTKC